MTDVGHRGSTKAQQVISDSLETYKLCRETAAYCVNERGALSDPQRIQVLYDCAEIHHTLADFLMRASPFHKELAHLCVDVAEACIASLDDLEHGDPQIRMAYVASVRSARSCAELAGREAGDYDERDIALQETFPASDPTPPPTEL